MEVTVHIGTGKAGSSSIQAFCRENRDRLGELGVLYPSSPGAARHGKLGLFLKSDEERESSANWYRQKQSDPVRFRKSFRRRLLRELESSGLDRVLMSDEEIFGMSDQGLRRLKRFAGTLGDRLRLVVYLRRQDDHLVSRYQQELKVGRVERLSDWAQQDMSRLYDYDAGLRRHERLVSPDEIVVRRFETGRFVGDSLLDDFLDATGVPARAADLTPVPNRNERLDAESVEFLRLVNHHRIGSEGAVAGRMDNRRLVTALGELSDGPVLTLPAPVLDAFMAQWEAPNHAVARTWFDDDGRLFRADRATEGTTTEQRLDPDRLDRFLALDEVPELWHAPLRVLAEREAASG